MVSLIVTDAKHKPLRAVDDYTLDLAYGSDENSFKLTCLPQPESSALIMIDGTEYGGLVTVRNTDGSVEGPTWHGLLSRRILQPDTGRDYLTVSGAAGDVLNMLFKRIGLDALFTASARHAVTIGSYSFDRYTDAYTGIRKMLAANNAKLRLIWADGRVNAYALPVEHYGDSIDSDLLEFKASLDSQPVNHLIGLGTGELKDRAVVHWYADVNGNVSQTQSLTGLAERQAVYDYSNAKPDELNTETRKKLIELQSQGGVEVTITDNTLSMDVGDTVTGRDNRLGITLTVPVAKKIREIIRRHPVRGLRVRHRVRRYDEPQRLRGIQRLHRFGRAPARTMRTGSPSPCATTRSARSSPLRAWTTWRKQPRTPTRSPRTIRPKSARHSRIPSPPSPRQP